MLIIFEGNLKFKKYFQEFKWKKKQTKQTNIENPTKTLIDFVS